MTKVKEIDAKEVIEFKKPYSYLNMEERMKDWDGNSNLFESGRYYTIDELDVFIIGINAYLNGNITEEEFNNWGNVVRGVLVASVFNAENFGYSGFYLRMMLMMSDCVEATNHISKKAFCKQLINYIIDNTDYEKKN